MNPSWLAVKPLDGEVLSEPPPPLQTQSAAASPSTETVERGIKPRYRPVRLSTSLLPVEYTAVSDLAPKLQTEGEENPDLVIHVGVSAGDSAIRLEQRARKFGYNSPDAAGKLADADSDPEGAGRSDSRRRGFVGKEWEGTPEELRTRVDGASVVRQCKSQGVDWISLSEDAGEPQRRPDADLRRGALKRLIPRKQASTCVNTRSSPRWRLLEDYAPTHRPSCNSSMCRRELLSFSRPSSQRRAEMARLCEARHASGR